MFSSMVCFLQVMERRTLADDASVDWIRWALKGHKGFLLTMDEVQHGITAEQFTTGLKKVDGAWTWDNEEWERARVLTAPAGASLPANEGQSTAPPKRRTKKVKSKKRSTSHMPIDVKIELLEAQGGMGLNGAADEDLGAVNGDEQAGGGKGLAGYADSVIDLSRTTVDPESPPAIKKGEGARGDEDEDKEDKQDDNVDDEEDDDDEEEDEEDDEDVEEDEDEEMRDGWVTTRQSSPVSAPSARSASTERGVNGTSVDAMQDVRATSDGGARSVSVDGGVNGSASTTRTTPSITPASSFQSTLSIVPTKHPGSTSTTLALTAIPLSTSLKRVREPTPPSDDNVAEHQAKKARVEPVPDESDSGGSKVAPAPAVPSSSPAISSSTPSALTTLINAMSADGSRSGSTASSLLDPPTTSVPPPTTTSIQPTTTSVTATSMSAVTALGTFDSNTMYTPTTTTTANQPFRSRATPDRTETMPYGEDSSGKGTASVSRSGTSVYAEGMGGSASSLGMGGGVGGSSTPLEMGVRRPSPSSSSSLGTRVSSSVDESSSSSLPRSSSFLGLEPTMMAANMSEPGLDSSVGMSAGAGTGIPAAGAETSLNPNGRTLSTLDPVTSTATATTSATSTGSGIQSFTALFHKMFAPMTSHKANDQAQSGSVDGSSTTGMPVNPLGATPKVNGSSSLLTAKLVAAPTMPALSGPVPSSTQSVSREVTHSATTSVIPAAVISTPSDLSPTAPATLDPTTTSTTNPTMANTFSAFSSTPSITSAQTPTPIWGDNAQSVIAPPPLTPVKSTPIPIVARSPSPSVSSTASTPPAARTPAPAPPVVNPSVVLPMRSTASADSIFTTTAVDLSSTTIGAELSTTTGDNPSATLVAGGISSIKPVAVAPLVPDVVLPSTAAPISSSEAPAVPGSKEPAVSSPATMSFAPVQSQVEEASGWPSNLFSSVLSLGASTTPASIASAAPLAAHTYAGSEDMEMSDEDGPNDPVEKPTDWSMNEAPSVLTVPPVDEEASLMDQASRLLESVIGPRVEKRTGGMWSMFAIEISIIMLWLEAPVITVPPAPVLPEVEPLKDLPVSNNSSGMFSGDFRGPLLTWTVDVIPTAPDQVAVAEKVSDAPQQPIPSGTHQVKNSPSRTDQVVEPTVAEASMSPLPAPEQGFSTCYLKIVQFVPNL